MKIYDSDFLAAKSEVIYTKRVTKGTLTIERAEGIFTFNIEVTDLIDKEMGENELTITDIDYIAGQHQPPFDEEDHENTCYEIQRHLKANPIEVLIAWEKAKEKEAAATI